MAKDNPRQIISGGQTGADRAGLDAAIRHGIKTGGFVPRGRMAEDGPIAADYSGLIETETEDPKERTERNVVSSDATVIFSYGKLAGGSLLTKELAAGFGKPHLHIDLTATPKAAAVDLLEKWIADGEFEILNVAGARASEDPQIYGDVLDILDRILKSKKGPLIAVPF